MELPMGSPTLNDHVLHQDNISNVCKDFFTECTGADYLAFGLKDVVYSQQTRFQFVQIVDTHSYGRMLYLDGSSQSSEYDEYIYHEALVHPVLCNLENPKRVLILGGGEGAVAREVLKYDSITTVDMVDIDEELVTLCKEYLPAWAEGAFEDSRLTVHFQDALDFVKNAKEPYDLVILDLIDEFAGTSKAMLVDQIYTQDFFTDVKRLVNLDGALVIQGSEFNQGEFASFAEIYRKIEGLFPIREVYNCFVPSFISDWGFIVCNNTRTFAALSVVEVDANIEKNLPVDVTSMGTTFEPNQQEQELEFYDGQTHQRLFSLPKDLRKLIQDDFVEPLE